MNPLDKNLKAKDREYSIVTKSRPSIVNYILPKFLRPKLNVKREDKMEPVISRLDMDDPQERIRTKISSIIESRNDLQSREPVHHKDNTFKSEIDDESVEDIFSLEQSYDFDTELEPVLENVKQQSYPVDGPNFIENKVAEPLIKYLSLIHI